MMGGNVVKEEQTQIRIKPSAGKITPMHVHSPPLVVKKNKRERIDPDIPVDEKSDLTKKDHDKINRSL